MKKLITVIFIFAAFFIFFCTHVNAEETGYDLSGVYESLSDEVKEHMIDIGADNASADTLSALSFDSIINEIASIAAQNLKTPLKGLLSVTASLIVCSMLSAYKSSLSGEVSATLNTVSALCVSCAIALPAVSVIKESARALKLASDLMLAYIPVTAVLMTASGNASSAATYYSAVAGACQLVSRTASEVVSPFLNVYLGLCVSSGISADVCFDGFLNLVSSLIKRVLGFVMTVFTAVLSLKQLVTASLDNVSGKLVKFAVSSFVPVVGSALSDAYKTVLGSVSVLKSGLGVFVIIALAVTFLPCLIENALWSVALLFGKSLAQALNLNNSARLLENLATVFSTAAAIMLCVMSAFIISASLAFMIGGGSA